MPLSVSMVQPSGWTGQFIAQSSNAYTPNSLGLIAVVQGDIVDAEKAGFVAVGAGTAQNGIVASATQTLAGATQLLAQINQIATCAVSGNAVKLPPCVVGEAVGIVNSGAEPASVFPFESASTIDGGSAGAAVTLTNAKRCWYFCVAAGTWVSAQMGAASA